MLASFAVLAGILHITAVCQRCHFQAVWATDECCLQINAALACTSCIKYAALCNTNGHHHGITVLTFRHINLRMCVAEGCCCSACSCASLQARRIWEAVLYAQPKVRTDEGLATLAQLVSTLAGCFLPSECMVHGVKHTCSSIRGNKNVGQEIGCAAST